MTLKITPDLDERLNNNISLSAYATDNTHQYLADGAWRLEGANIGKDGEHLTISFLSLNRANLSLRLLDSIATHLPRFKGQILVADNGSDPEELAKIEQRLAEMPHKSRIVCFGENLGVGGGRNRSMEHVQTEWVMFLDNDIYFTHNFLGTLQREISQHGAHFISLPLLDPDHQTLFAQGGHLFLSQHNGEWHIGAGSVVKQRADAPAPAMLCTFLFGGAACIKRDSFNMLGGFHPEMFIGFEDIEFSIRIFRAGMKVASSGQVGLVHDHPKPEGDAQIQYEQKRFSRQHLFHSAQVMLREHGFHVWSAGVEKWLAERRRELNLGDNAEHNNDLDQTTTATDNGKPSQNSNRPKIALVTDAEGWAFDNIALQLQKHLSDQFEFRIIPANIVDNLNRILIMTDDCHILHFFWREHVAQIYNDYWQNAASNLGLSFAEFERRYIFGRVISSAIYDHLFLTTDEMNSRATYFNRLLKGYYVASNKLRDIYQNSPYPAPLAVLEDGVDLGLFKPKNLERLQHTTRRPVVIGWAGNSLWGGGQEDFKGLHTILLPAIERLRERGYSIETKFADRAKGKIPHHLMPDYYAQIDIFVCASKIEGTPNPVLEAMACGVPIVTTDVGIVPQAFGEKQKHFILPERSIEAMTETLARLIDAPHELSALSAESLQQIQTWDWAQQTQKFARYFNQLLGRAEQHEAA